MGGAKMPLPKTESDTKERLGDESILALSPPKSALQRTGAKLKIG